MVCRRVDRDRSVIYCWFFCEVTVLSLVGVALWLSLTPRNPRFMISAALDSTTTSLRVHLQLQIFNPNNHMGIDYSGITFTLYASSVVVAANSTSAFHQGYKNTTLFHMPIQTSHELWKTMNATSDVDFLLRLETAFRFQIIKWRTKVHHIGREARFSKANININGSYMELLNAQVVKTRN